MSTQNIALSNTSQAVVPNKASSNKASSNDKFQAAVSEIKPTEVKSTEVKTKLTDEEKVEFAKQAEATALANKKTLLETMFSKGKEGDTKALRIFYQEAASAIEGILKKELGDESFSLQNLMDKTSGIKGQEDYWSSEKTADRIMTGATSYFDKFKEQNPKLSNEEAVDKYMSLITPALEKGMGEAVDILKGFGAFEGGVKDTVQLTQQLVHEKLAAFREKMINIDKPKQEDKPLFDDANTKGTHPKVES
ncbi:MAG: DUF5610 domain-containing protein [Pseudomonadaceae bacterium]|nr:DUF5610 domain-containing protein [Pseudomonadaceae bacterium]